MVFPWRQRRFRPGAGSMSILYAAPSLIVVALSAYLPSSADELTATELLVLAAAGLPLLVVLALALPLAALMALFASVRRARQSHVRAAYVPTVGIFVSELGGGLLGAILGVLLQTLGWERASTAVITVLVFALNVLAPVAYGIGVGRYRVLSLDPDAI